MGTEEGKERGARPDPSHGEASRDNGHAWENPGDDVKLMEINAAIHDLDTKLSNLEMALRISKGGK